MLEIYLAYWGSRLPEDLEHEYLSRMPSAICTAVGKYHRWEDRQATLFGKMLLQHALRNRMPEPLSLDRLEYTINKKPFIRDALGFNISHSEGVVALALVDDGEVGIDVEKIRPIGVEDFLRYMPELSGLPDLEAPEGAKLFFDCWTKKEAVLKGDGCGLMGALEQVYLREDTAFFHEQAWRLMEINCVAADCCYAATSEFHSDYKIQVIDLFQEVQA